MITTAIFHCLFNKDSSITHFMHADIDELAKKLPHLYVVLLCQRGSEDVRNIEGAIIFKTELTHYDEEFIDNVHKLCVINKELSQLINSEKILFLHKKIRLVGSPLLSEYECLQLATQQYLKYSQTLSV